MADMSPDFSAAAEPDDAPVKRGPGRPRGSKNGATSATPRTSTRATQDTTRALATMRGMYEGATAGLMLFGLPMTAAELAGRIDSLQATNRQAFDANPRLAKTLANVGSTGGTTAFFMANGVALFGIVSSARSEWREHHPVPEPEAEEDNAGDSAPFMG